MSREDKLARKVSDEIQQRGFSPTMFARFLADDPHAQPALYDIFQALMNVWSENFRADRYFSEVDREVYRQAAQMKGSASTRESRSMATSALPSDDVWDSPGGQDRESYSDAQDRDTYAAECELVDPKGHDFTVGVHGEAGWSTMEEDINCNLDVINCGGVLGNPFIPGAMWFPQPPGETHYNEH